MDSQQPGNSSRSELNDSRPTSKSSKQTKNQSTSSDISITSSMIDQLCKEDLGFMRRWKSLNSKVQSPVEALLIGEKPNFQLQLLHKIFEENSNIIPDLPAIVSEDNTMQVTYKELSETSNRIARTISAFFASKMHKFNQNRDWIIALYMRPTYRAVICMLASWKLSAGYLPLNFEDPKSIKQILNQAKPQLVIVDNEFMTVEIQKILNEFSSVSYRKLSTKAKQESSDYYSDDKSAMNEKGKYDNLAMVLYSSELLATPKGTRIFHHNCHHRLEWQWTKFPYQADEKYCIAHNAIHHISHVAEIWGPLLKGKTLVLMRNHCRKDIERIITTMQEFDIMRFYGFPSKIDKILDSIMEQASKNPKTKKLLTDTVLWMSSGDVLEKETALKFFNYFDNDGKHTLVNLYGCTETTGDCCFYIMKSLEQIQSLIKIPIGFPCFDTRIYILDEDDDPVEKNQKGEIHIVGPYLSRSYIDDSNDAVIKHNRYSMLPAHWTMFNSQDYGSIIEKLLYYDGKKKLKVRYDDYSINYSTVEKVIKEFEYVENAIVIPTKEQLVAFIILEKTQVRISLNKVDDDLRKELPEYAVPEIVLLHKFPLLQDGEIDKEALIQNYNQTNDPNLQANENLKIDLDGIPDNKKELAKRVFAIIGNNIGNDITGTIKSSANFFNIGGSSLNAVSTIYELFRTGYSITADNFLKAKDFNEILNKIEPVQRHSCIREDYGFASNDNWRISIIRFDDLQDCLDCLLECYIKKHVLIKLHPKITTDNLRKFIESNWINFFERRLSFKVVDRELDKIIGVALNIDLDDESLINFDYFKEFEPLLELRRFMEDTYVKENYRDNAYLTNYFMGTSMDISPADNVNLVYHMEKHLIQLVTNSGFNGIFSNGVCPLNLQICDLILDYKIIEKYAVNRFVDKSNNRPFQNARDDIVQYTILNHRLNSRVDSMVKDGLLVEIRSFYNEYVKNRDADYEEGILQTIGFKEFIPYLEKYDKSHDDLINKFVEAPETLPEPDGYKSLLNCLNELKLVTQRYSKKQIKWIKNRFLGSEVREVPKVYPLDTSDVSKWKEVVYQPAEETILSYIADEPIKLKALDKVKRLGDGLNEETSHYCEVCDRIFIGEFQWQLHIKSNNHKRKNARRNRMDKNKTDSEEVVEQKS